MTGFVGASGAGDCVVSGATSLGVVSALGSLVVGSGVSGVDRQAFRDNTDETHSNSAMNAPVFESACFRFSVIGDQPNSVFRNLRALCGALRIV
jgi:hypothetical protein